MKKYHLKNNYLRQLKRMFCVLMSFVLCLSVCPIVSNAEESDVMEYVDSIDDEPYVIQEIEDYRTA